MDDEYKKIYNKYNKSYLALSKLAKNLEIHLSEYLVDYPRKDRISVRAKLPEKFAEKAIKCIDGKKKYKDPFIEIQDQIGARIVTYYLVDVERISEIIDKYYEEIEIKIRKPDSHKEFSYFGKHYILFIPDELRDEETGLVFFELQIKTLFQHAWAEAEHDLNYKSQENLSLEDKRYIAFSSAQAWGAGKIFNELFCKYNN